MIGRIESVNISRGGVPKAIVFEALITEHGLAGDHQNDLRHHGGPDRAVVLYSLVNQDFMRIFQGHRPGWSRVCARVLEGGIVRPGDAIAVEVDG